MDFESFWKANDCVTPNQILILFYRLWCIQQFTIFVQIKEREMITFRNSVKCLVYWARRRPRKSLTSICPTIDVCEVRNDREWRSEMGCKALINQSEASMINTDQWEAFYELLVTRCSPRSECFFDPGVGALTRSDGPRLSVGPRFLKSSEKWFVLKYVTHSHCYCHSDKLFLAVFHKNARFESCRQHVILHSGKYLVLRIIWFDTL